MTDRMEGKCDDCPKKDSCPLYASGKRDGEWEMAEVDLVDLLKMVLEGRPTPFHATANEVLDIGVSEVLEGKDPTCKDDWVKLVEFFKILVDTDENPMALHKLLTELKAPFTEEEMKGFAKAFPLQLPTSVTVH
jgi:hypothetical protein